MNKPGSHELEAAERETDPTVRRLWIVAAVQAIVAPPVFLVGGSAVDLHTGSYMPTDIDLVGAVGSSDRAALIVAGFLDSGGRHLQWVFTDGSSDFVEFRESDLDGTFEQVALSDDVTINVITVESLVVDRIHQATDGTAVTFDEAVRLVIAVAGRVDWVTVATDMAKRPEAIYLDSQRRAREILAAAGSKELAETHFGS